ncbi:ATP-binding protein [Chitinimonas koreensis]|uniref:ATP-binding protein n=1 Tax=Chitinimonas koreensis TaxID=356302 RepID=UPI000426420E|nr:ATP-binding protein [Chitinimonas koreensis]QNM96975.1 response regulator [Chitinimonas koreensis]
MAAWKVLYLEDSPLDAMLTRNALGRIGLDLDLHLAQDAVGYTAALARERYDLVISDSTVPGCQGYEALWLARQHQPQTPFIYFSGHTDELVGEAGVEAGALDVIDKRDLWRLKRTVRQLFDHAASNTEPDTLYLASRRQERLTWAVQQLMTARRMDEVAAVVRTVARELVFADGATFVLREGDRCHYLDEDALTPLWKGQSFPLTACVSGWSMLHREQVTIPDIYADARVPHDAYRPTFVQSMVMTPVRRQAPIAAIGTYWAQRYQPTTDELALLQTLADTVALALENVQLYSGLEQRVLLRTAQLEAVNRELEAFSYSVSHDLRAPLRAINGFGNLLLEDCLSVLPEDGRHYLFRICAEAARMNDQLDDLLKLFRMSAQVSQRQVVDLGVLAAECLARLRAREPGRKVTVHIAEGLKVNADPGLAASLVENLVGNAWKYTGRRADARIELGVQPDAGGNEAFYVRDNGAGFDLARATKLFAPFQRFHSDRDFPGTGIGLALCQRIVHLHGGRIWAESKLGEGATFYFTLP